MKKSIVKNNILIVIILLIGLSAYLGFKPLFNFITSGALKEFLAAIFGTVFTIILTMTVFTKFPC